MTPRKNNIKERVIVKPKKVYKISFSPADPTIVKQLRLHGFSFNEDRARHWEQLKESIHYLDYNDLLTDSSVKRAKRKLFNLIKKHIKLVL